jgi:hypothetical protein
MMNNLSKSQMQDELKRRSTLSRLEGVAEAVWMYVSDFWVHQAIRSSSLLFQVLLVGAQ